MEQRNRILIVEDDLDISEQVQWLLEEQLYVTKVVPQLTGIWEIMAEFKPDLILLDISLPDGDGRDLCIKIKSTPATSKIPVIFLSSHPYIYDTIIGLQANDVIMKPFDIPSFVTRIKNQLFMSVELESRQNS